MFESVPNRLNEEPIDLMSNAKTRLVEKTKAGNFGGQPRFKTSTRKLKEWCLVNKDHNT